jgi:hypothetical protein
MNKDYGRVQKDASTNILRTLHFRHLSRRLRNIIKNVSQQSGKSFESETLGIYEVDVRREKIGVSKRNISYVGS